MVFYEKVKPRYGEKDHEDSGTKSENNSGNDLAGLGKVEMSSGIDTYGEGVQRANKMHSSHGSVFDGDFHVFLKEILKQESGNLDVLKMSLTFFFDVLIHSCEEESAVDEWVKLIGQGLEKSPGGGGAKWLVETVANKVEHALSGNWLKSVSNECTLAWCRSGGLKLIGSAIKIYVEVCVGEDPAEVEKFTEFMKNWNSMTSQVVQQFNKANGNGAMMPTKLQSFAAPNNVLGTLISSVAELVNASSLSWNVSGELMAFVLSLSRMEGKGGAMVREGERSERALRKTRILAIDPAKWLQTAATTSTTKLN